jgi:ribosomal protein L21E
MQRFEEGDVVRVDIPDKTDPDHDKYHRQTGRVIDVIRDDASMETSDERDNIIYRVSFGEGDKMDFRWRDLFPK